MSMRAWWDAVWSRKLLQFEQTSQEERDEIVQGVERRARELAARVLVNSRRADAFRLKVEKLEKG